MDKINIKQFIASFALSFGAIALYDGLRYSMVLQVMIYLDFFIIGFMILPLLSGIFLISGYYGTLQSKYYHKYLILMGIITFFAYRIYLINHWISMYPRGYHYWYLENFYEIIILAALIIFTIFGNVYNI